MEENARLWDVFLDVQRGLPRQGPGNRDSTSRALSLCGDLPENPRVLDIGCGPGMQTLALAQELDSYVTAVDFPAEYLDQLKTCIEAAEVMEQVEALAGDMNALAFAENTFDLIWAEGSAYIMGFAQALEALWPLKKPGGYLAATELVWLRPEAERTAEATAFFADEYPAMTDVKTTANMFRDHGHDLVGHFTLPDAAPVWRQL
jgi:ubiquinone/menaquinone biosynthesis C-methylase UbiE